MMLDVFKRELMNRNAERAISVKMNDAAIEAAKPTQDKQGQLEEDLVRKKERLDLRRKERIIIAAAFFDYEDSWTDAIQHRRVEDNKDVANQISKLKIASTFCDLYANEPSSYLERILSQTLRKCFLLSFMFLCDPLSVSCLFSTPRLAIKDCESLGITYKTPKFVRFSFTPHLSVIYFPDFSIR